MDFKAGTLNNKGRKCRIVTRNDRTSHHQLIINGRTNKKQWRPFIKTVLTICFAACLGAAGIYFACLSGPYKFSQDVTSRTNLTLPSPLPLEVEVQQPACTMLPPPSSRFNCWPEVVGATPDKCSYRGCCWRPHDEDRADGAPVCFYPAEHQYYIVTGRKTISTGIRAYLSSQRPSRWPGDVNELILDVTYDTPTQLHIKIFDTLDKRYQVPIPLTPSGNPVAPDQSDFVVDIPVGLIFTLTVTRKSTGEVLFDTREAAPLVVSDQFISLGTSLSTGYNYGLGEHMSRFLLDTNWTILPMWTRDKPPVENTNLYGSHPFMLSIEKDNQAHGLFLLNSNALEAELQPAPAVTFRTSGGILDFYLFSGPTPDNVVQQYTRLVGRPFMPPYWALGFHLCRFGYHTIDKLKEVIHRMREGLFPYDTQWGDIDYMRSHLDWTYDPLRFKGLPEVVLDLHNSGQHYVVIVDPGISSTRPPGTYPAYDDGMVMDVFIKKPDGSGPIVGEVWPGRTVFPDFFHPNATIYWTKQIQDFHNQIPFDGLWTDMNEPSNFVDGSVDGCPSNNLENPPFVPRLLDGGKLRSRTLCASAQQYLSTHYNLHSMYGLSEVISTKKGLEAVLPNQRSIVISRSTFPSSGHHGGHWLGDNWSNWEHLFYSIPGMLSFQLFGIPLVGADICGFNGNTTPELCARWMQLGAFYPFMRNHNSDFFKDQDPAVFDKATQQIMRDALHLRYTLLPYLYTLMYRAHVNGSTVARPLFFHYPNETIAYTVDRQFMWGSALLITPALSSSITQGEGYLPRDRWYDWFNHSYIDSPGHMITFDLPMEHINLQVRGGSIVPLQEPAVTTTLSRKKPFSLLVALSNESTAEGELFWDDGLSQDSIPLFKFNHILFQSEKRTLRSTVVLGGYTDERMTLSRVDIMGVDIAPTGVLVNSVITNNYIYINQTMTVFNLFLYMQEPFTIEWLI